MNSAKTHKHALFCLVLNIIICRCGNENVYVQVLEIVLKILAGKFTWILEQVKVKQIKLSVAKNNSLRS